MMDDIASVGIPPPDCRWGYPTSQLEEHLSVNQMQRLMQFMGGQTMTLCEGRAYNHQTKEYYEVCDGVAHGTVIYAHDLWRFLVGLPVVD
jgi:hypothetical protein